jgi:hypothetical protein
LTREEKTFRDDRLFIIATEDTHAPKQYFRAFPTHRITVKVLGTRDGLSSPEHVSKRLEDFVTEFELEEDDELWLMLDTDHWTEPNHINSFSQVCKKAKQKGVGLAHSNPCFELWLLLHHVEIKAGESFKRCCEVEERLRQILGEYNKSNIGVNRLSHSSISDAVERAKNLDPSPRGRWPQTTGTHVHRLVKKLLGIISNR